MLIVVFFFNILQFFITSVSIYKIIVFLFKKKNNQQLLKTNQI